MPHSIELALLLLVALILGCVIGFAARQWSRRLRDRRGAGKPPLAPQKAVEDAHVPPIEPGQNDPPDPSTVPPSAPIDPEPAASASTAAALRAIRGIGPKLATALNAQGISSVSQIANWQPNDISRIDKALNLRGCIVRDQWVEQARALVASADAEREA